MDGILSIDKPRDWTSFDVVAFVRRRSGVKRVGHAGTLDPMAEGVLPVCLGQATRVVEYLMDSRKTYVGRVRFGQVSDTYDVEGRIVAEHDPSAVTRERIEACLGSFRGKIEQRPPQYSALKRDGVPLYRLARRGEAVEVEARRVTVHRLELLAWEPPVATVEVECSKGTYIRALAHDIGAALGPGALLEALTRTAVGPFDIGRSLTLETLKPRFEDGTWTESLIALDEVMLEWPAAILGDENGRLVLTGRQPHFDPVRPHEGLVRAYGTDGRFLAVLRSAGDEMAPAKVFHSS